MMKLKGFNFLINRGCNPGFKKASALFVLFLKAGESSPVYVDPDVTLFSFTGRGVMLSIRNRESGMIQVSIKASGCKPALAVGRRSMFGFCADVFRVEIPRIKIIYTTMYLMLYVYASNILIQRYVKILIPCNT